ncbi:hypothetical protein QPK31_25685 [Massilia sp. YIM B02769]|uniref:hypothetical protein n=1 Tax=Massilia sp. YIM B02769 TaxID=3050129 RepID=UPI0025B661CE|nr:hypothetical protein [Massilia sp. YIM B02769]MDN4061621.1 hypothetical protein [Massilia sp. YIM B02769]
MMGKVQTGGLSGTWAHSYEEDEGDVQVYRPHDTFPFPPSRRGRETLDFRGAGEVISGMPGPDDRQLRSAAELTPLGMNRFRLGDARVIEVLEAGPDVLKLRPG